MSKFHAKRELSRDDLLQNISTAMASARVDGNMGRLEKGFKENEEDENAHEAWMETMRTC